MFEVVLFTTYYVKCLTVVFLIIMFLPDFTLDMDRLEVQKYLNKQFGYGYSSTRHRFRKKYQKYDNMEEAKAHVPKNVSQEAWHDMCESFADKKWKVNLKLNLYESEHDCCLNVRCHLLILYDLMTTLLVEIC